MAVHREVSLSGPEGEERCGNNRFHRVQDVIDRLPHLG
jgi:hypothetical protein